MRAFIVLPLLLSTGAAFAQDHAHGHPQAQPQEHGMSMPDAMPMQDSRTPPPDADAHLHDEHAQSNGGAPAAQYQPPALTDADRAAAFPELHTQHDQGDPVVWMVQADRFEYTQGDAQAWDGKAWIGHDRGRLWLRSEGERSHGKTTSSLDVLWGTPANAWWDVLAGMRHDQGHGPSRDWIAVGVQGLAPYWFEVQATAYLGSGGRSMLEAEVEYELLLTNRLILQPRAEMRLYGRDDVSRGVGAGLSESAAGLRLRYEIRREFAPYVGYEWSSKHGRTADLMRAAGEPTHDQGWVAGLRFWF